MVTITDRPWRSATPSAGVAAALRVETDAIVTPVDVRYERLPAMDLRADFDLASPGAEHILLSRDDRSRGRPGVLRSRDA